MNLKFRDYIYIIYMSLLPFTLILIILRLNNIGLFTSKLYYYVILLSTVITIISFVWSLLYTLDDVIYKDEFMPIKNIKLTLLGIFSIFYIPIHYISNNYKKYSFISILLIGIFISAFYFSLQSFNKFTINIEEEFEKESIVMKKDFDYYFDDDLFVVNLDFDYVCQKEQGDYRLYCDNKKNDSFIGIYSYIMDNYTSAELKKAYTFHVDQTKQYIVEAGYTFTEEVMGDAIVLTYNDNMQVYMKESFYDIDYDGNDDICLVLIYELPNDESNLVNFYNFTNSIRINNINS